MLVTRGEYHNVIKLLLRELERTARLAGEPLPTDDEGHAIVSLDRAELATVAPLILDVTLYTHRYDASRDRLELVVLPDVPWDTDADDPTVRRHNHGDIVVTDD